MKSGATETLSECKSFLLPTDWYLRHLHCFKILVIKISNCKKVLPFNLNFPFPLETFSKLIFNWAKIYFLLLRLICYKFHIYFYIALQMLLPCKVSSRNCTFFIQNKLCFHLDLEFFFTIRLYYALFSVNHFQLVHATSHCTKNEGFH